MYVCMYIYTHIHIWMVRRLAFLAPPPRMVWFGRGAGWFACAERGGGSWVGVCRGAARGDREGRDLCKPFASHKPYNVGRVPVFTNLNLYLMP